MRSSRATGSLPLPEPRVRLGERARLVEHAQAPRAPLRVAFHNSRFLASHTVQVTSEAKTRPTITIFTTMSALRNMPQGDRSRGSAALAITGAAGASAGGWPVSGRARLAGPAKRPAAMPRGIAERRCLGEGRDPDSRRHRYPERGSGQARRT